MAATNPELQVKLQELDHELAVCVFVPIQISFVYRQF
jgi:hypothetical protein